MIKRKEIEASAATKIQKQQIEANFKMQAIERREIERYQEKVRHRCTPKAYFRAHRLCSHHICSMRENFAVIQRHTKSFEITLLS